MHKQSFITQDINCKTICCLFSNKWFEKGTQKKICVCWPCVLFLSGKSCGYREIGSKPPDDKNAWSDRDLALTNGPITAFKVWHTTCGIVAYVDVPIYTLHVMTTDNIYKKLFILYESYRYNVVFKWSEMLHNLTAELKHAHNMGGSIDVFMFHAKPIYQPIHPPTHPYHKAFNFPESFNPYIHSSIHPSIGPFIHPSVNRSFHQLVCRRVYFLGNIHLF